MKRPLIRDARQFLFICGGLLIVWMIFAAFPTEKKPTYAVDASTCEKNLRQFRIQLSTIAKGSNQTAEALEATVEQLAATSLPADYVARTEADLLARGCQ